MIPRINLKKKISVSTGQPKQHHLYSCASVDKSTLAKKGYAGTGILMHFSA